MGPIQITTRVVRLFDNKVGMTLSSSNDSRCWVAKDWSVYIEPAKENDRFPVYLQFESNFPITAVGFSTDAAVAPFTKKGPCGGSFFLECDIDPTSTTTPLIRNDGPGTVPPTEYHFMLWFENGEKPAGIDPQIYNQGDTGSSEGGRQKGWLVHLLRKLLAWLER